MDRENGDGGFSRRPRFLAGVHLLKPEGFKEENQGY